MVYECDRRELWKELRQMVNKVSEDVKALYESHNGVLEKVKALVESNMTMKEELLRVQEDLENMSREELQSLASMETEGQMKPQEPAAEEHNDFSCLVQSPRILCNQPDLVLDSLSMRSLGIVYPKVSKFYNELHTILVSYGVEWI